MEPNLNTSDLIYKALKYAEKKHQGQKRKGSGADYITHPILVSYLVAKHKPSSKALELLICAAVLHDTVEDTNTTYEEILARFGMQVTSLVFELTSDPKAVATEGKAPYLKRKLPGLSNYGLFLKLCDRLGNLLDKPSSKTIQETREVLEHLQAARKLTRSQLAVVDEISKVLEASS